MGVYLSAPLSSSSTGRLHLVLNDTDVVPAGIPPIPIDSPLHAVVDVYGSTKEVSQPQSISNWKLGEGMFSKMIEQFFDQRWLNQFEREHTRFHYTRKRNTRRPTWRNKCEKSQNNSAQRFSLHNLIPI